MSYPVIQCSLAQRYFPAKWKVAQIILILMLRKPHNELTSYQPISLLHTVSKVLEKLFLKRLLPMDEINRLKNLLQLGWSS
jgi:hypothetical protein